MREMHNCIENRFLDKVCIVTGGSAGIGKAIVEEFCKEGGKALFTGINKEEGRAVEEEFLKKNYKASFLYGDMGDDDFCKESVNKAIEKYNGIDYLVNNAFAFTAASVDATMENWMHSFKVGPLAYARMSQHALPFMKKSNHAAIVNISSVSAHIAQRNRWTYNAGKGFVNQLTKCQALDLAPYGIRVNSIDPGWIWTTETDKAANLDGGGRKKWDKIWGQFHLLERLGQATEVARPILFLLSVDASFITGTSLLVDGGYSSMGPEGLGNSSFFVGSE